MDLTISLTSARAYYDDDFMVLGSGASGVDVRGRLRVGRTADSSARPVQLQCRDRQIYTRATSRQPGAITLQRDARVPEGRLGG